MIYFSELDSLDYTEIKTTLYQILLDPLDYAIFIESAWLLGPKAFIYEKK